MPNYPVTKEFVVQRPTKRKIYPFEDMQPGHGFFIKPGPDESLADVDGAVRAAYARYRKRNPHPKFFVVGLAVVRGARVVGCWCRPDGERPISGAPLFTVPVATARKFFMRVHPGESFAVTSDIYKSPSQLTGKVRHLLKMNFPGHEFTIRKMQAEEGHSKVQVFRLT